MKGRKYLTYPTKDVKPIKTNHRAIHNHKIAALLFLMIDNGSDHKDFKRLADLSATVADILYSKVPALSKGTYIQKLEDAIERRVTKNIYIQAYLLSIALIQGQANSKQALEIINLVDQLIGKNPKEFEGFNPDSKLNRLHRVIKKCYKPIS